MKGFDTQKRAFYFVPFLLFFVLVGIVALNNYFLSQIQKRKVHSNPLTFTMHPYPILRMVLGTSSTSKTSLDDLYPTISAQAAVIIDNDSQVVLFSKNPYLRFSLASTTKIMTALVALDYYKLDDILTVEGDKVPPAVVGFKKGEQVRFEDMLYGLLLPSGNDAALAIAQNYPGGEETFINKMNEKAKNLHLIYTHFEDSSGFSDNDFSTVLDLGRLASFAVGNPVFTQVVDTKSWTIRVLNSNVVYSVRNLNKLLGVEGVTGIKTGYTEEAGEVLVTSKMENGHTLILVVMKSEDRFGDTEKLLRLVSGNVLFQDLNPSH